MEEGVKSGVFLSGEGLAAAKLHGDARTILRRKGKKRMVMDGPPPGSPGPPRHFAPALRGFSEDGPVSSTGIRRKDDG